jgi:hypothetical protein
MSGVRLQLLADLRSHGPALGWSTSGCLNMGRGSTPSSSCRQGTRIRVLIQCDFLLLLYYSSIGVWLHRRKT